MASRKEVQKNNYVTAAIKYKKQMDDIIDVAYCNHPRLYQMKRFKVTCITREYATRLGDCCHQEDGSSLIRLMNIEGRSWDNIMLTLIHEIGHHIDTALRGESNHDEQYFDVYVRLLFAAFDMGIITEERVLDFKKSESLYKEKLALYVLRYKQLIQDPLNDICQIIITGGFDIKDQLKESGYIWQPAAHYWMKEVPSFDKDTEVSYLNSIGLEEDIYLFDKLYKPRQVGYKEGLLNIYIKGAFSVKDQLKKRGYSWNGIGKHWETEIDQESLSEELEYLKSIGLDEEVSYENAGAVKSRTGHCVKVYNVTKRNAHIPKSLGYKWNRTLEVWQKDICDDSIPEEERKQLMEIPYVRIKII